MVALLFNYGTTANVPRHLRSPSEDVVVQETAAEENLDENVVDNDNLLANNEETLNTVNLLENTHNAPDVAVVENAATKTKFNNQPVVKPVVNSAPVQTVPVQSASLPSAPLQSSVKSVHQAPARKSVVHATPVVHTPTPQKQVVYNQVPHQSVKCKNIYK